jgi:hypothetical protein
MAALLNLTFIESLETAWQQTVVRLTRRHSQNANRRPKVMMSSPGTHPLI